MDGTRLVEAATHLPNPDETQFERCCILQQGNTDEFRLVSESLDLLSIAKYVASEQRVEFFFLSEIDTLLSPPASLPSSHNGRVKPAFTMTYNANVDEWTLVQSRCECCNQRPRHLTCEYLGKGQQMAIIRHSRRKVGQAMVHNVDLYIPPTFADTGSAIWCPAWTGRDLTCRTPIVFKKNLNGFRSPSSSPRKNSGSGSVSPTMKGRLPEDDDEPIRLHSKLPTWDPEVEHLVLNFTELNRKPCPSPRNFMLVDSPTQDGHIVCQHASIGGNTWCLDFKHPLNVVQAFAIAMSSINWD